MEAEQSVAMAEQASEGDANRGHVRLRGEASRASRAKQGIRRAPAPPMASSGPALAAPDPASR